MKIANFKVEEWMNSYTSYAKHDLTTTCIAPLCINELDYDKKIFNKHLDYGEIKGSKALREEIKKLYTNQEINNITTTHGAIGANQLVFLSLLEKGDEVVSIVPTYQQHYSIPESLGCNVKLYFLKEENNWLPDIQELEKFISSKTKLLCLNNPNNPTGSVIPNHILFEIADLAKKYNFWILSDEVYRGLNLYGNPYSLSIADIYDKGISVGSMSKTYSLPGLRVGWIVAREDLINEINHQRQYNTISISILDDYFATIALKNKNKIENRNFEILKNNLEILKLWLTANPNFKCVLPTGGTTILLKYNQDLPSKKYCYNLLKQTGVALLPGETFEMEGYVRLGYCASDLSKALNLISIYTNTY